MAGWCDMSPPRECSALFAGQVTGEVRRYEIPSIGALNFVLYGMADGGVTRTLALDAHGKSLSSALLDMEIPDDDGRRTISS